MTPIQVQILMGSDSDAPIMRCAADVLRELGISCEMTVASAHRSPARVQRLVAEAPARGVQVFIVGAGAAAHLARVQRILADAPARGVQVFIVGAGAAAHLAGMVAAHTAKPVIGVPIDSSPLLGLDALLSTVQMPPGVPVATVAVGKSGATNAGVLAAQILAIADPVLEERVLAYKARLADKVEQAAARLAADDTAR